MIYAAFMIGLAGSLHCLGMCGPIAFALPVRSSDKTIKFFKYLLYNTGRVFTYALLGLFIGVAGKGFALAGLQQSITIATGILIIASVFFVYNPFSNSRVFRFFNPLKEKIKKGFHYYFQHSSWYALFILGVLNGLLPCGMVYAAMIGALATGSPQSGALFMAAFGIGTIPMMMTIALSKNIMTIRIKSIFQKVTPVLACLVGALLIIRGLNLNIPYISPSVKGGEVHKCH